MMAELDAATVKRRAKELGADLAGIASAATLNAFPPDPRWPQTPDRISPYCKSVIVLVQRIPAGAFRCKTNVPVQYIDMLVLRKMDKVAYRLAEELEQAGHPSFVTAAQETDWNYKRASYGRLSTRHLGVEAGLGTLGLEVNILTPEFGPRIYLTGVLTELELEPDHPMTEQVCIGESCSRCLHSCPGDAVLHFGIDKRGCAEHAQEFGFAQILKFFEQAFDALAPWLQLGNWSSSSGANVRQHAFNYAASLHGALYGAVTSYPGRVVFGGVAPGFDDWVGVQREV